MKTISLLLVLIASHAHGQQNRFGQPRAIRVEPVIRITPTLVLPGVFIQGFPTTIDLKQARLNAVNRRQIRRKRLFRWH